MGVVSTRLALLVVGPLLALPASFIGGGRGLRRRSPAPCCPGPCATASCSGSASAPARSWSAAGLAVLVSFYDFPGRRWLEWALVLPMAMPAYVLVFVVLGQYGLASPLHSNLLGDGLRIPGLRTPGGAIVILTAVLYPYVYVLGRSAFLGQSRQALEAARCLGRTYGQAVRQRRAPARPAGAGGRGVAGGHGGPGRLRHRRPPRRPGAHQRHLPGLVRHLRPGLRAAARHRPRRPRAHDGHRRAGAARAGPLPPGAGPRRRRDAPRRSRAGGAGLAPAARSCSCWWCSRCPSPSSWRGRSRPCADGTVDPDLVRVGAQHRRAGRRGRRSSPSPPRRSSPTASASTGRGSGRRRRPAGDRRATPCRAPSSPSPCSSRSSASTGGSPTGPTTLLGLDIGLIFTGTILGLRRRLRRAVPRPRVLRRRGPDEPDQPRPRRRRSGPGRRPGPHPGRRPPPAARPRHPHRRRCWCSSRS